MPKCPICRGGLAKISRTRYYCKECCHEIAPEKNREVLKVFKITKMGVAQFVGKWLDGVQIEEAPKVQPSFRGRVPKAVVMINAETGEIIKMFPTGKKCDEENNFSEGFTSRLIKQNRVYNGFRFERVTDD